MQKMREEMKITACQNCWFRFGCGVAIGLHVAALIMAIVAQLK